MKSHRVTITEAVNLTERSRRSLYRDMSGGRLTYHVGHDGRRLVDVSELIRAYGALPGMPESAPEPPAPADDEEAMPTQLLAKMLEVMREQSETLEALREEVHELRRLPAPGQLAAHSDDAKSPTPAPPASVTTDTPPRNFGDLLARFETRNKTD